MFVKYTEGPDEVEIPATGDVVKRGAPVEVRDEIGKQLIVQGWEKARGSSGGTPKAERKANNSGSAAEGDDA